MTVFGRVYHLASGVNSRLFFVNHKPIPQILTHLFSCLALPLRGYLQAAVVHLCYSAGTLDSVCTVATSTTFRRRRRLGRSGWTWYDVTAARRRWWTAHTETGVITTARTSKMSFYRASQVTSYFLILLLLASPAQCLQCFDTVGWAAGRASGL